MSFQRVILTGANGVVGRPLQDRLLETGMEVVSVSRGDRSAQTDNLEWNLQQAPSTEIMEKLAGFRCLVHCAPIWFLPAHIEALQAAGLKRVIAFSSTSVISKTGSADEQEQALVSQLSKAETALRENCTRYEIDLTILRPSMIYGYGRDQNVMQIARFIRRFGFMVLVGQAAGLRQPVHADDLVQAVFDTLESPITYDKTYNLAGGEVLSYRAMVERIFTGLARKPKIISLPLFVYRCALKAAAAISQFSYTAEMADRMNQDLAYDIDMAQHDFSFNPKKFLVNPDTDLRLPSELQR